MPKIVRDDRWFTKNIRDIQPWIWGSLQYGLQKQKRCCYKTPLPNKATWDKALKTLSNSEKAIEQLPNITHKAKVS